MAGTTNKFKFRCFDWVFRRTAMPSSFYVALCTSAVAPTQDTDTLGQLTQIAAGNGYTSGGFQLSPNSTDFDVLTEDDSLDRGIIQVKDIPWTAAGGAIPGSGNGARWAVLTDANATVGSREVYVYWDLGSDRSVSSGQTLTLQNCQVDNRES